MSEAIVSSTVGAAARFERRTQCVAFVVGARLASARSRSALNALIAEAGTG